MVIKDLVAQLLPQASELLKSIYSRRVDLAEAIAMIRGIDTPANVAGALYRAVAVAASARNPELENWALLKALEAGPRDAETLLALQRNWADLGNLAEADRLDAEVVRALCSERRAAEALPALARLFAVEGGIPAAGCPLEATQAGAVLDAAQAAGSRTAPVRRAIRAWLPTLWGESPARYDYNLALLDLDTSGGPQGMAAFAALLADPGLWPREPFAPTRDLRFLIRTGGRLHWVAAGRVRVLPAEGGIAAWAAISAQFHADPSRAPERVPQAEAAPVSRRSLAEREGHAVANLDAMPPIMAEVFGLGGFAHPEVHASVEAIIKGADKFFATGVNSEPGYGKLLGLYCATNGLSCDFLSFLLRLYNPPYPIGPSEGILGRYTEKQVDDIAAALRRDGLYRFPNPVPRDLLDDLIRIGHSMPCYPHREEGVLKDAVIYPAGAPKEMKYNLIERDLITTRPVQRLMADPGMLAISQAYLGAKPVLDALAMWWSTHLTGEASSEAAQMYHFDFERIRWLKWFIYLTDVTPDTGPHCFVRGSHRTGAKPQALLKRGYQRISDADMAAHYPAGDLLELTGPAGSIFVEDTSGFHKGKAPRTGPRLVIELEYANSLYGCPGPRESVIGRDAYPPLLDLAAKYPQVFCKFAVRP